jgi:cytochrome c biogenesis protein CcdA
MGKGTTVLSRLPWLALYNFVYILPLLLLTILIAYGISAEQADSLRTEYKRTLRMVKGAALVVLGAVIRLGWFG